MITSFILWAMRRFDGATFGICGKTVRSAERNIIMPLQSIVDITHYFKVKYTRSVNLLLLLHLKSFLLFLSICKQKENHINTPYITDLRGFNCQALTK